MFLEPAEKQTRKTTTRKCASERSGSISVNWSPFDPEETMSDRGTEDEPWEEESTPEKDPGLGSLNCSSEEGDELSKRIVAQLEFYFSDDSILRDPFLLKHVRRNREGYVSLKLMASFRKVKYLTKNWEFVRKALHSFSTRLEVNADGTKVRRREPLPDYDETAPSRTVVAYPLSVGTSVEAVAEMFSRCGPISQLRLLRPGDVVPPCARRFLRIHPDASGCTAAVVEFERHQGAFQALTLGCPLLHVLPLIHSSNTATVPANIAATERVQESGKRGPVVPSLGTVSGSALEARNKSHTQRDASTMSLGEEVSQRKPPRAPPAPRSRRHQGLPPSAQDVRVPAAAAPMMGSDGRCPRQHHLVSPLIH